MPDKRDSVDRKLKTTDQMLSLSLDRQEALDVDLHDLHEENSMFQKMIEDADSKLISLLKQALERNQAEEAKVRGKLDTEEARGKELSEKYSSLLEEKDRLVQKKKLKEKKRLEKLIAEEILDAEKKRLEKLIAEEILDAGKNAKEAEHCSLDPI